MVNIVPELQRYRINCLQPGVHQVAKWEQEVKSGRKQSLELSLSNGNQVPEVLVVHSCKQITFPNSAESYLELNNPFWAIGFTGSSTRALFNEFEGFNPVHNPRGWKCDVTQCNLLFHHLAKTKLTHKETKSSKFCIKRYALCKRALLWFTWI